MCGWRCRAARPTCGSTGTRSRRLLRPSRFLPRDHPDVGDRDVGVLGAGRDHEPDAGAGNWSQLAFTADEGFLPVAGRLRARARGRGCVAALAADLRLRQRLASGLPGADAVRGRRISCRWRLRTAELCRRPDEHEHVQPRAWRCGRGAFSQRRLNACPPNGRLRPTSAACWPSASPSRCSRSLRRPRRLAPMLPHDDASSPDSARCSRSRRSPSSGCRTGSAAPDRALLGVLRDHGALLGVRDGALLVHRGHSATSRRRGALAASSCGEFCSPGRCA